MTSEHSLAFHDFCSVNLVYPALRIMRGWRRQTRDDNALYAEGYRFRADSWSWTTGQRRDWILRQIRAVVRAAYTTTRYYRELFDSIGFDPRSDFGFDDYALLPILERQTVQERRDDLISNSIPPHRRAWNATGGSSGRPVEIFMGPAERAWRISGADFSMAMLSVQPGVRRALLWGHHLDPVARDGLKDRVLDVLGNRRWYDCLRLSEQKLLDYDTDMRAYRPRALVAYASALHALAEAVRDSGRPAPTYPTRRIVTGAEKLFEEQRALIESVFSVPLHERYGSRDVGDMGFQYEPERTRAFRVDWALVLLEPATTSSESDILVTKLHGDAMPMIRYRTDDVARFNPDSSPGHPTFELQEVLGRRANQIFKPDGGWVHGIHFPHLMKEFPVSDFQIVQAEDYSVVVSVVPRGDPRSDTLAGIQRNLEANLQGVPLTVRLVGEIPRTKANKWQPVVSAVKRGR